MVWWTLCDPRDQTTEDDPPIGEEAVDSEETKTDFEYSNVLLFYLNGKRVEEKDPPVHLSLLEYLRQRQQLTGTKLGCNEGGCGACTVMISHFDVAAQRIRHLSVNACMAPLVSIEGKHVTTVEGIGSVENGLHPVQKRIAELHGSQCGFCTPGIVMALYAFLRENPKATASQIEENFDGNLCRCTGYRPILDAAKSFASDVTRCPCGKTADEGGCPGPSEEREEKEGGQKKPKEFFIKTLDGAFDYAEESFVKVSTTDNKISQYTAYDGSSALIFPPDLQRYKHRSLRFEGENTVWYRPTSLVQLLYLKSSFPEARLVVGNTELHIQRRFKNEHFPVLIQVTDIPELTELLRTEDTLRIGASASLNDVAAFLRGKGTSRDAEDGMSVATPILQMLRWFGSNHIRNVASIGGNIATASPISDLNPVWQAENAIINVISASTLKARGIPARSLFTDYRTTTLEAHDIIVNVEVDMPPNNSFEFHQCYKQAKRRDDDIAVCTGAFRVELEESKEEGNPLFIKSIGIAFGGMAKTSAIADETEAFLTGKPWRAETIEQAYKFVSKDVFVPPDAPGGMEDYRLALACSFLFKFYIYVSVGLQKRNLVSDALVPDSYNSAADRFERDLSSGVQQYQVSKDVTVGTDIVHQAADIQVSGEAIYLDDMPVHDALHGVLLLSTVPHANLVSVDISEAEKSEGFVGYFDKKDIGDEANKVGNAPPFDEEAFCSGEVKHAGQVIGIVVADTVEHAKAAMLKIKVEYEELDAIMSIDDAIAAESFIPIFRGIEDGDIEKGFEEADHVLEGDLRVGGQEQWYLECQAVCVVPGENQEVKVYATSQHPRLAQTLVARVLERSANKVDVHVKRIGGGFGGKETRCLPLFCAAAVAADKLKKPVRIFLDRDVDQSITGGRHPFYGKWKIGVTNEGRITTMDAKLYSNAGFSLDMSAGVMDKALFNLSNCYGIPNCRSKGFICRTNMPTNTAFRGFGAPQVEMICEDMIEQVACYLKLDINEIRRRNFYKETGDQTYYHHALDDCPVPRMYESLLDDCKFEERRSSIREFNTQNRFKKRGIAAVPTIYGVGFSVRFLNQAGALVHVYMDGSVLLTHGGIEMGQGLHTKMIQIAASSLGCPPSSVHITETATDKVPNTSPTVASSGSDLNGMAVFNACRTITERLKPLREEFPDKTFAELAKEAYFQRINLSAQGFYATPNVGYDFATGKGAPYPYYTYGVAASEVEVDTLTGDHQILRTDILMDVGISLNPMIDIGQIEGSFVQGAGLFTTEELIWGDKNHKWVKEGSLHTRGPGTYKIPSFGDVPTDFRVSLLKDHPNRTTVHSSKGVGEPALFLGAAAFFAIKEAIKSARADSGIDPVKYFKLNTPATSERIRMACADHLTRHVVGEKHADFEAKVSN